MELLPYSAQALRELADELDAWKARLDYRGPLPRAWAGRLRRDLEAESVAASTSMEGVPVTVEEVRRILVGDVPKGTSGEDVALVRGYRDAMSFVLRRADDPTFRWDRELIIGLHDRVLAGNWAAGAGRLRSGPALVVNNQTGKLVFSPPEEPAVPALIDEACAQIEGATDHSAVASAWIHVAVAAIHPFKDGNGRSARVLASLAMYRGGSKLPEFTSLEEWWGRHLQDYYEAFVCLGRTFDRTADVTPFLHAHMEAQLHQVRALDLRERVERRIWAALEEAVTSADMEPRVVNAIWDAFFGREVTPRYYRPLADVSAATATNDLAAAVAAGLLRPVGKGRSRTYVVGDELYARVGSALDVPIGDAGDSGRPIIVAELTQRVVAAEGASAPTRMMPRKEV
jgi:Fic family protein